MTNHRLFFALWPDDDVRARIETAAASIERSQAPGGRRVRPDRLHLTLQFLGDFAPLPAPLVASACEAAAAVRGEAFDLALDEAGSFRGSRVWWLGCGRCPPQLQALWSALGRALAEAGVATKAHPTFTPHVTVQRNARKPLRATPIDPVAWPLREFVLIDSQPDRGYVELGRWRLDG